MSPTVQLHMPVPTERHVERTCALPVEALVLPVSYNLVLILIAAIYGYKTRKLPNNFNESGYIFSCVCSTLFLWVAFLPTYFAAFHATHKSMLLILSLLLNSSVILVLIFVTRIYALYYVEEDKLHFSMHSLKNNNDPVNSSARPRSQLQGNSRHSNADLTDVVPQVAPSPDRLAVNRTLISEVEISNCGENCG